MSVPICENFRVSLRTQPKCSSLSSYVPLCPFCAAFSPPPPSFRANASTPYHARSTGGVMPRRRSGMHHQRVRCREGVGGGSDPAGCGTQGAGLGRNARYHLGDMPGLWPGPPVRCCAGACWSMGRGRWNYPRPPPSGGSRGGDRPRKARVESADDELRAGVVEVGDGTASAAAAADPGCMAALSLVMMADTDAPALCRTARSPPTSTPSPWPPAPASTTTSAPSRGRMAPPPPSPSRTPTSR